MFVLQNVAPYKQKVLFPLKTQLHYFVFLSQKTEKQSPEKIISFKEDELRPPGDCEDCSISEA